MNKKLIQLSLLTTSLILSGCGGGGGSSSNSDNNSGTSKTGILIDDIVQGVKYVNNGKSGYTNEKGEFTYTSGKVEFYVGKIKIGQLNELTTDKKVFVQDLAGTNRDNISDDKVIRIASFLQSLDSDPSTDEIEIKQSDFDKFNDTENSIEDINYTQVLQNKGFTAKTKTQTINHLNNVLKKHTIIKDNTEPSLSSVNLQDNNTNIEINKEIIIKFSEDILKESIKKGIILEDSQGNKIDFDFEIEDLNIKLKLKNNLKYETAYVLKINNSLKDYANNSLGENKTINFTTKKELISGAPVFSSANKITIYNNQINIITVKTNQSTVTFTLEGNDANDFTINAQGQLNLKQAASYSTKSSYSLSVKALNDLGLSTKQDLTITVNNINLGQNTISHNTYSYNIITSPITGKKWLDRNLGASAVCSKSPAEFSDVNAYITSQKDCFGDYYQWGRLSDGHEKEDSSKSSTKANSLTSSGVNFVTVATNSKADAVDWLEKGLDTDGSKRKALWSKIDGTSVCPIGFRVPSSDELFAETKNFLGQEDTNTGKIKVKNSDTAYKNFLKLPSSGTKIPSTGNTSGSKGNNGHYWSSDADISNKAKYLMFYNAGTFDDSDRRSAGRAVRCVEN